jgi:hypothetical protein
MSRRFVYFQGLTKLDNQVKFAYFNEDAGTFKIFVSSLDDLEVAAEVQLTGSISAAYGFSYLPSPSDWISSILAFDPNFQDSNFLSFSIRNQAAIEQVVPTGFSFSLYNAGNYSVNTENQSSLYLRDGTIATNAPIAPSRLLFAGVVGPSRNYRFAPDLSHCIARISVGEFEYRDNLGVVKNLTILGATLPQFNVSDRRYTYIPPYLYFVAGANEFDVSVQTVTVHRNLVDLINDTVTFDINLTAQCKGIDFDETPGTSLATVFYPG